MMTILIRPCCPSWQSRSPCVSKPRRAPCFQLGQAHSALHYHRLIQRPFFGNRAVPRVAFGFQPHFHLPNRRICPGLRRPRRDLLAVDESAVGGIEVPDDHVVAAQQILRSDGCETEGSAI